MERKVGRVVASGVLTFALLVASGCTIRLHEVPLDPPPQTHSDALRAATTAEGIEGMVGWGRLSLFYIPVAPIFVVDDTKPSTTNTRAQIANREVMKQVRRALEHVGYQVESADPAGAPAGLVLQCRVEKFWFNNYTWLAPFIPTWGSATITVTIVDAGGQAHWSQTFDGSGFTMNFFDGYTSAANSSMKKILNQMVKAFASPEFRQAATPI